MPAIQSIEIKKVLSQTELGPGKATEIIEIPNDGKIQVIGTSDGFAVRRIGEDGQSAAGIPDVLYYGSQSLTIHFPDHDLIFQATKPVSFEASPIIDGAV